MQYFSWNILEKLPIFSEKARFSGHETAKKVIVSITNRASCTCMIVGPAQLSAQGPYRGRGKVPDRTTLQKAGFRKSRRQPVSQRSHFSIEDNDIQLNSQKLKGER